jgi:heterodisulfide reductase subunit A-like polyferredoxin
VRAAVRRVALHKPLQKRKVPINPNALVVGGGISGTRLAVTITRR